MDFANLDLTKHADTPETMDVMHPVTDTPLMVDGQKVQITVLGAESSKARQLIDSFSRKALSSRNQQMSPDRAKEFQIELLTACTVSWANVQLNGQMLEPTKDNIMMMYRDYPWLRQQVDAFMSNRANFFKA